MDSTELDGIELRQLSSSTPEEDVDEDVVSEMEGTNERGSYLLKRKLSTLVDQFKTHLEKRDVAGFKDSIEEIKYFICTRMDLKTPETFVEYLSDGDMESVFNLSVKFYEEEQIRIRNENPDEKNMFDDPMRKTMSDHIFGYFSRPMLLYPNKDLVTPIERFVYYGDWEMVQEANRFLKDEDWDSIRDIHGSSLLMIAIRRAIEDHTPDRIAIINHLLEKNSSPLSTNKENDTCIVLVASQAYPARYEGEENIEDVVDVERGKKILQERESQKDFRKIYDEMMLKVHPFQMVTKLNSQKGEPLLSALFRKSPKAVDLMLNRFESSRGFDGISRYTINYNFALNDEHWYQMMKSLETQKVILAILKEQNPYILGHNAIRAMMKAFWNRCCRQIVIVEMAFFALLLICTSLLVNLGVEQRENSFQKIATWILCIMIFVNAFFTLLIETMHMFSQGIRAYAKDFWNYPDWACSAVVLYCTAIVLADHSYVWQSAQRQIMALAVLYYWMKVLEYGGCYTSTGTISRLFLAMLLALVKYLLLMLVFVFGFGHCLFLAVIQDDKDRIEGFKNVGASVISTYRAIMGDGLPYDDMVDSATVEKTFFITVIYVGFTVSGLVLLINLLIALMTKVYDEVQFRIDNAFLANRADFIDKKLRVYVLSSYAIIFSYFMPRKTGDKAHHTHQWDDFVTAILFPLQSGANEDHHEHERTISDEMEICHLSEEQVRWNQNSEKLLTIQYHMKDVEKTREVVQNIERNGIIERALLNCTAESTALRLNAVTSLVELHVEDLSSIPSITRPIVMHILSIAVSDKDERISRAAMDIILKLKTDQELNEMLAKSLESLLFDPDDGRILCGIVMVGTLKVENHTLVEKLYDLMFHSENQQVRLASCLDLCMLGKRNGKLNNELVQLISLPVEEQWRLTVDDNDLRLAAKVLGETLAYYPKIGEALRSFCVQLKEERINDSVKLESILALTQLIPFGRLPEDLCQKYTDETLEVKDVEDSRLCSFVYSRTNPISFDTYKCQCCRLIVCKTCSERCHAQTDKHPKAAAFFEHFPEGYCDCVLAQKCHATTNEPLDAETDHVSEIFCDLIDEKSASEDTYDIVIAIIKAFGKMKNRKPRVLQSLAKCLSIPLLHNDAQDSLIKIGVDSDDVAQYVKQIMEKVEMPNRELADLLGFLNVKDKFVIDYLIKTMEEIPRESFRSLRRLKVVDVKVYQEACKLYRRAKDPELLGSIEKFLCAPGIEPEVVPFFQKLRETPAKELSATDSLFRKEASQALLKSHADIQLMASIALLGQKIKDVPSATFNLYVADIEAAFVDSQVSDSLKKRALVPLFKNSNYISGGKLRDNLLQFLKSLSMTNKYQAKILSAGILLIKKLTPAGQPSPDFNNFVTSQLNSNFMSVQKACQQALSDKEIALTDEVRIEDEKYTFDDI